MGRIKEVTDKYWWIFVLLAVIGIIPDIEWLIEFFQHKLHPILTFVLLYTMLVGVIIFAAISGIIHLKKITPNNKTNDKRQ